jgi:hypothetical protein
LRAAQVRGVQGSHRLAVPLPAQTSGPVQSPQCKVWPQPSLTSPQLAPSSAQVLGRQQLPCRQRSFAVQSPQCRVLPQPSLASPQVRPRPAQVRAMQCSHRLAVPLPAQTSGAVQSPQCRVLPQPSEMSPQSLPSSAQVVGVQHWC